MNIDIDEHLYWSDRDDREMRETYAPDPWPTEYGVGDLVIDVHDNPSSVVGVILGFMYEREYAIVLLPDYVEKHTCWHSELTRV